MDELQLWVKEKFRMLSSMDKEREQAALREFENLEFNDTEVWAIIKLIRYKSNKSMSQIFALGRLLELKNPNVSRLMLRLLTEDNNLIKNMAREALKTFELSEEQFQRIVCLSGDGSTTRIRKEFTILLGIIGTKEAVNILIEGIESRLEFCRTIGYTHENALERFEPIVEGLEKAEDKRAVEPLLQLLESTRVTELRVAIAKALGNIGINKGEYARMEIAITNRNRICADWKYMKDLCTMLGYIGTLDTIPLLLEIGMCIHGEPLSKVVVPEVSKLIEKFGGKAVFEEIEKAVEVLAKKRRRIELLQPGLESKSHRKRMAFFVYREMFGLIRKAREQTDDGILSECKPKPPTGRRKLVRTRRSLHV